MTAGPKDGESRAGCSKRRVREERRDHFHARARSRIVEATFVLVIIGLFAAIVRIGESLRVND